MTEALCEASGDDITRVTIWKRAYTHHLDYEIMRHEIFQIVISFNASTTYLRCHATAPFLIKLDTTIHLKPVTARYTYQLLTEIHAPVPLETSRRSLILLCLLTTCTAVSRLGGGRTTGPRGGTAERGSIFSSDVS